MAAEHESPLFGPNNHSKYKIRWNDIASDRQDEIRSILQRVYGLTLIDEIKQVDEWERMSNNFRIRVTSSTGPQYVLLRKHIQLTDERSVLLLSKVLDFLDGQGIRVPTVIHGIDGSPIYRQWGHFYQLYDFISGDHYRGTISELRDVAANIARLHISLGRIPFVEEILQKPETLPPWEIDGWIELFDVANTRDDEFSACVNANRDFILQEAKIVIKSQNAMLGIRKQVIRGDLHPHDTLYREGKLEAFLDFEGVRVGELWRDVANACHRFVRQFLVYQKRDWRKTLPLGIELFLTEYDKVNPFDKQDAQLVPMFIRDEILRKLFKDLRLHYLQGNRANIEGGELEKKLTLLREAEAIAEVLATQ